MGRGRKVAESGKVAFGILSDPNDASSPHCATIPPLAYLGP